MYPGFGAFTCPHDEHAAFRRGLVARVETPGVLFENSIVCLVVFVLLFFVFVAF
jgi:hypothetical protein